MAMTLSMEESVTWEKKEEKERVVVSEFEKVFFLIFEFFVLFFSSYHWSAPSERQEKQGTRRKRP